MSRCLNIQRRHISIRLGQCSRDAKIQWHERLAFEVRQIRYNVPPLPNGLSLRYLVHEQSYGEIQWPHFASIYYYTNVITMLQILQFVRAPGTGEYWAAPSGLSPPLKCYIRPGPSSNREERDEWFQTIMARVTGLYSRQQRPLTHIRFLCIRATFSEDTAVEMHQRRQLNLNPDAPLFTGAGDVLKLWEIGTTDEADRDMYKAVVTQMLKTLKIVRTSPSLIWQVRPTYTVRVDLGRMPDAVRSQLGVPVPRDLDDDGWAERVTETIRWAAERRELPLPYLRVRRTRFGCDVQWPPLRDPYLHYDATVQAVLDGLRLHGNQRLWVVPRDEDRILEGRLETWYIGFTISVLPAH